VAFLVPQAAGEENVRFVVHFFLLMYVLFRSQNAETPKIESYQQSGQGTENAFNYSLGFTEYHLPFR
jgi:hypothetical protein